MTHVGLDCNPLGIQSDDSGCCKRSQGAVDEKGFEAPVLDDMIRMKHDLSSRILQVVPWLVACSFRRSIRT